MTTALYRVEDLPNTREALESILATDDALWSLFEQMCLMSAAELRGSVVEFRETLLAHEHSFDTHEKQFEETFLAILTVAEELLPESPGAVRARLRERVQKDVRSRDDGGVRIVGSVDVRRAVEIVLAFEDTFFDEFILAAGVGHARLYFVARRVKDSLSAIGREFANEEIEDEVWMLVRGIAPDSPAARPDAERLQNLWVRAQKYVKEHDPRGVLGDEARQQYEIRALAAIRFHDLAGYRAALRGLCRAARDENERGADES